MSSETLTDSPEYPVKPLQIVQNEAARLFFDQPNRAHVSPLLIDLYWLHMAIRTEFKSLMFVYRVTSGSPPELHHPGFCFFSATGRRLALPSLHTWQSQSRQFSFAVPQRWNKLPNAFNTAASISIFIFKTYLLQEHLLSHAVHSVHLFTWSSLHFVLLNRWSA